VEQADPQVSLLQDVQLELARDRRAAMTSGSAKLAASIIEPANGDPFDLAYRFGKPLSYLSEREQVRLLIVRGRLQDTPADNH
jgi:hypothetical protein